MPETSKRQRTEVDVVAEQNHRTIVTQWEFQDPNMEVLHHRYCNILWEYSIGLENRPGLYGRYLQSSSVPEMVSE